MQMEALECGAAALAMVMAYYGKWVPLEQVRLDCGVSRDGSNAKNVLIAARNYGFEAQGYRCEPDSLRESILFPCIIHWNFNHFVVLDGFKGDYAYINDPARGEVKIRMDEFDRSFTGICLPLGMVHFAPLSISFWMAAWEPPLSLASCRAWEKRFAI
jgi:ABC-type bacteriocin/lantibiotic exporter with double-glycine peptidase domain